MLHLHTDRLAELGDEVPTPDEAAHLASCDTCASERMAFQSLVAMAHAEREPFGLPLTRWDAIAAELAREPVVAAPVAIARTPHSNRWMLQIAAGLLLVAGGVMAGRASTGAGILPQNGSALTAQAAPNTSDVLEQVASDTMSFTSTEEARAAQQQAELKYQQAVAYLARHDSTAINDGSPTEYRSRLAALDNVLSTTREAMRSVPHDPVINGYYLTTLGQREATLRQLNTALPASMRVNSF